MKRAMFALLVASLILGAGGCCCNRPFAGGVLGRWGCGGCGPKYRGDWKEHPPECCESCDSHGNWTGPADSYPWHPYGRYPLRRVLFFVFHPLFFAGGNPAYHGGYHHGSATGSFEYEDGEIMEGEVVEEETVYEGEAVPETAQLPTKATWVEKGSSSRAQARQTRPPTRVNR